MAPVPFLPGSQAKNGGETLPVVDEYGQVRAQMSREYAHSGSKVLHPVVHLHIIDRMGRVYLQQRAEWRRFFPGKWDTAAAGHVTFGETISEALFREVREELGIEDFNPVWLDTYVYESGDEKELVHVFAAVGNFELSPDGDEVTAGRYWTDKEIFSTAGRKKLTPGFYKEYRRLSGAMKALL